MNTIFSGRLKYLLKERNKTQDDMAALMGVRRSTYGEYECGKIAPPMDRMKILADFFGVSVDYLMGNTNVKTHAERSETESLELADQLESLLVRLSDDQSALTFGGELLDEESRNLSGM